VTRQFEKQLGVRGLGFFRVVQAGQEAFAADSGGIGPDSSAPAGGLMVEVGGD